MSLKSILGSNAHWNINKKLAFEIGFEAAGLLQHLIDLDDYKYNGKPFFQQESYLLNALPLTVSGLRSAKKILVEKGFITVIKISMPAKNYFTIHDEVILKHVLDKNLSGRENSPTDVIIENSTVIDENTIKNTVSEKTPPLVSEKTPPLVSEKTPPQNNNQTKNQNKNQNSTYSETDSKLYNVFVNKLWPNWPEDRKGNIGHTIKIWNTLSVEERMLALKNATRYKKVQGSFIHNVNNYLREKYFRDEYITSVTKRNNSFNKNSNVADSVANNDFNSNNAFLDKMRNNNKN